MSEFENNDGASDGLPGMPPIGSASTSGVGPEGLPEAFGEGMGGKKKSVITSGTLLVMILFVIAGGGLFIMNYTQMGITDAGKNTKHEKTVENYLAQVKLAGAKNTNDRIAGMGIENKQIAMLHNMVNDDITKHQVPVDELRDKPFQIKRNVVANKGPKRSKVEKELVSKLTRFAKNLKVTGVLTGGAVPTAIINGKLFDQGAKVGPFILTKITRKTKLVDGIKVSKRYIVLERKNFIGKKNYRISLPVKKK